MQTTLRRGYVHTYTFRGRRTKIRINVEKLKICATIVGEVLTGAMIFGIGAAFYIIAYCYM